MGEEPAKTESNLKKAIDKISIDTTKTAMICITFIAAMSMWLGGIDSVVGIAITGLAGLGGYEVGKKSETKS